MKNTLEGINSKINGAEQISDLGNRLMEITAVEQNKFLKKKNKEDSLRDIWDKFNAPTTALFGS